MGGIYIVAPKAVRTQRVHISSLYIPKTTSRLRILHVFLYNMQYRLKRTTRNLLFICVSNS